MEFENLSREELRNLCKEKGVVDYMTLSKAKLIRILISLENPEEVKALEKVVDEVVSESEIEPEPIKKVKEEKIKPTLIPLSAQALKWKSYLKQLGVTPKDYLNRFPDHLYRRYIEELI